MDKGKQTIDRVRHILQAMEQSIDAARARRTNESGPVDTSTPEPLARPAGSENGTDLDPETASRMRARPMRPRGMSEDEYRRPMRP